MMQAIDLFSGIGGISFALGKALKTVLYCECDENARKVLRKNMSDGHLPAAEICPDVRQLNKGWMKTHGIPTFQIILAGFPCVGFSSAGKREGYMNAQTSLFFEMMRVVDASKIHNHHRYPYVFMENVPRIIDSGIDEVVRQFVMERGYSLRWCTFDASDVGAPQKRRRWYCIAIPAKNGCDVLLTSKKFLRNLILINPYGWNSRREPARMTVLQDGFENNIRISMLGNAVVPDAIRKAFVFLIDRMRKKTHTSEHGITGIVSGMNTAYVTSLKDRNDKKNNVVFYPEFDPVFRDRRDFCLILDPRLYKAPRVYEEREKSEIIYVPIRKTHWATVTKTDGESGTCHVLTRRSSRKIKTQVRFEEKTSPEKRRGQLSPTFVEWLMGYPLHWTHVKS